MSAPHPANTSEELVREAVGNLFNEYFDLNAMSDELKSDIVRFVADHDAKRYAALEAAARWHSPYKLHQDGTELDPTDKRLAVPIESVKGVFNMKEDADGDSK